MTKIEDYWEDITIYSVEFMGVYDIDSTRKYRRTLAFSSPMQKQDVFHLVTVYFMNVEEVLSVDEIEEGLMLKQSLI